MIKGSPEWKKAHPCRTCGVDDCWNVGANEPGDACWEPPSQSATSICHECTKLRKLLDAVVHSPAYDGRHPKEDPIILDDLHPDTRAEVEAALKPIRRRK
jgi:hypothetical protein